jgi:hypothetical protein
MFNENRGYLESCYKQYANLCEKKKVLLNISFKTIESCRKKGYFCDKKEEIAVKEEMDQQIRMYSELKGLKDVQKKTVLRWMQAKIKMRHKKQIKESVVQFIDYDGKLFYKLGTGQEEEINCMVEEIIEKPNREWMGKIKTKIRYNFAEDPKKTWNRLKQTAGQVITVSPEEFKNHYEKNWAGKPVEVYVKEYSDYIMQRKLVIKESDMLNKLLDVKKNERCDS